MISLRTKDEVTLAASDRLFARADSPETVSSLNDDEIAMLIYPAGFYRTKAGNIRRTAEIIRDHHRGEVPRTLDELVLLPGVGRKTANLVMGLGHGIPAICVDTHVHRISNRNGWVASRTPEETETRLAQILPERYWIEVNTLLVAHGQLTCTPRSPRCSACPIAFQCPMLGVDRHR
jgi:endonuclease-3